MSEDETHHLGFPKWIPVVVEANLAGLAATRDLLAADLSVLGQIVVALGRGMPKPKPPAPSASVLPR